MFERYAIFYTPPHGPLQEFGAAWLGWDSVAGQAVAHPEIGGLDVAALTKTPRKYGLHGTLKAPFRLGDGVNLARVQDAAQEFAGLHKPVSLAGLELQHEHGFIGLRPACDQTDLNSLAANIVRFFDPLRAPLTDADIARRRKSRLSPRQDQQMLDWGYPFIFEDFHFHLTLSGAVQPALAEAVINPLRPALMPLVPSPFVIDAITVMGEDGQGMFHQIHRYALTG